MVEKKRETKSPIKDLPVNLPGQSLRDEQIDIVMDRMLPAYIGMTILLIFAFAEWLKYFELMQPHPWIWTIIASIGVVCTFLRFFFAQKEIDRLKKGRIGEEAVGQLLEEKLRPLGCQVLHDIPFDGFNIDHVVIGATGIYTIETKTHSKPEKGACEVVCDGENITVNGYKPDRDPIVQARASARSLYELLESSTGKKFIVKPVVLYPGWYVKSTPSNAEVWVLNEKALPTFIGNSKKIMPPEDVSLITFHLKRYVIARGQEKR